MIKEYKKYDLKEYKVRVRVKNPYSKYVLHDLKGYILKVLEELEDIRFEKANILIFSGWKKINTQRYCYDGGYISLSYKRGIGVASIKIKFRLTSSAYPHLDEGWDSTIIVESHRHWKLRKFFQYLCDDNKEW